MNYFQLFVVLLAGAALVSAAAFPRIDANGGCEFGLADSLRVEQMVQEGDDPAALAEMINGCRSLTYNVHLEVILRQMIFRRRHAIFAFLFPLIDFEARVNRNDFLSGILVMALCSNSIQIADFVMSQGDIQPELVEGRPTWRNSGQDAWKLPELLDFFTRHPEYAAVLSPTYAEMLVVRNAESARILVELARHCDNLSGQHNFDAARWLGELLTQNPFIAQDDLARVAYHLIQEGAPFDDNTRSWLARYPEALQLIDEWDELEVKYPGCQ